MALPIFDFYSRAEYLADITGRIAHAKPGDSVSLMTMSYDPRVPSIKLLTQALQAAAERGVHVRLVIDAYSLMLSHQAAPGPLLFGRQATRESRMPYGAVIAELSELQQRGGQYAIINQPGRRFPNPYAGRSHIKLAVINDRVYIPSCNLDNDDHLDLAVGWRDNKTARWLEQFVQDVMVAGSVREALKGNDITHPINGAMTLFVDSGVRKQSAIYDQAMRCIDQAQEDIFITCQYFPGGETARHLRAAKERGLGVTIRFSPASSHGSQFLGQAMYTARERRRMPAAFFAGQLPAGLPKLHAKLLSTGKVAITGSHNYVTIGVNFGTAEIALLVKDPAFAQAATAKMSEQLPPFNS